MHKKFTKWRKKKSAVLMSTVSGSDGYCFCQRCSTDNIRNMWNARSRQTRWLLRPKTDELLFVSVFLFLSFLFSVWGAKQISTPKIVLCKWNFCPICYLVKFFQPSPSTRWKLWALVFSETKIDFILNNFWTLYVRNAVRTVAPAGTLDEIPLSGHNNLTWQW